MKRIENVFVLLAALLLSGCVTADQIVLDKTPRTPTTAVDVFKDGNAPDQKCKIIAELTFLGPREDELRAQKRFVNQAEKLGGNGILFNVVPAGEKGGGLGGISTAWLFKGKVIAYE